MRLTDIQDFQEMVWEEDVALLRASYLGMWNALIFSGNKELVRTLGSPVSPYDALHAPLCGRIQIVQRQ